MKQTRFFPIKHLVVLACTLLILVSMLLPQELISRIDFLGIGGDLGMSKASAAWYDNNWLERTEIEILGNGSATDNYSSYIDAYYGNHAPHTANGVFEWFMRTGCRYEGTYDRTYWTYYSSTGAGNGSIHVNYWDEDSLVVGTAATLWTDWGWDASGVQLGDDHACGSVIALQFQGETYGNSNDNGKILVAAAEHCDDGRLQTRRSTSAENISAWDSAVSLKSDKAAYARLIELNNGLVFLFYRLGNTATFATSTDWAYTSTDGGASWVNYNSGNPLWERNGETDTFYTMMTPSYDYGRIHVILNPYAYDAPAGHQNIYYLQYNATDNVWYKVDGTTEFTLGTGTANMTLVYETDLTEGTEDWTYLWDVMDDGTGKALLLYLNDEDRGSQAASERIGIPLDVLISVEKTDHSGFDNYNTGITSDRFGTYGYPAGAVFGWNDGATIYTCANDSGSTTQMQRWTGSGISWANAENITQNSDGWSFRPIVPMNAKSGGYFQVLFCYTERYSNFSPGNWESMLHSYPGFNNGNRIKFSQNCRTDFGDLRFTSSDGETLLGVDGKPFLEKVTTSWRARVWFGKYSCPSNGNSTTVYCYYSNNSATNANDTAVMQNVFQEASHFDHASVAALLDDGWDNLLGDITLYDDSGTDVLKLTGTTGTRGSLENETSYGPGIETRARWKAYTSGTHYVTGWRTYNVVDEYISVYGTGTPNRMTVYSRTDAEHESTDLDSCDVGNYHVWAIEWNADSVVFKTENLATITTGDFITKATHTTRVPDGTVSLRFTEANTDGAWAYIDWVFQRPLTTEPTINVQVATEYLSMTVAPTSISEWYMEAGGNLTGYFRANTWYTSETSLASPYFTITNTGGADMDIAIAATANWTGIGKTWTISESGTPGDSTIGIYAGLESGTYTVLVASTPESLAADIAPESTQDFGLKVYSPTTNIGQAEMSGTITLTASTST